MKKLLIVLLLSVLPIQAHAGKTANLIMGAGAGAVAGYLIGKSNSAQAQPQQVYQPPQPYTNTHSIIMCQTIDGINCILNVIDPTVSVGMFVRKAGYNYYYRVTPLLQGDKQYIQIEVSK